MTDGPISTALTEELLAEIQRQGIVVWLDKDASYTAFVDRLVERHRAGAFPFPVVPFRGSFVETLFALEQHGSGYDKHPLVVHMPGFNEDAIRGTPLLELYEAGTRFRRSLETLVRQVATGRVPPDPIEELLRSKPTLEQADAWLAQAGARASVGLEALLEATGRTLVLDALTDPRGCQLAGWVTSDQDSVTLRSYLHRLTGMDDEWRLFKPTEHTASLLDKVIDPLAGWLLCVEYVQDLRREPYLPDLKRLRQLSKPLADSVRSLVVELRKHRPEAYERLADEIEATLDPELRAMKPEDLGSIDTFRVEESRVLEGAVELLMKGDFPTAADWCRVREGDRSFWIQRDPGHRRAWDLVAEAAAFGQILADHPRPFEGIRDFYEATTRYAERAALVDRAHRRLEQDWLRRLDMHTLHNGALQEVLGMLRQQYRDWADQLARDFTDLCRAQGFLPPEELQQRTLYDQVVQPLAHGGEKVAVFLVDALRYEMATELLDELSTSGGGVVVDLKARFAELPTVTSVGMNALAPVARDGRLAVVGALDGFKAGEVTVRGRAERARTMGIRTTGTAAPHLTLAEICALPPEALKRKVKDQRIVVVCSSEFDDAGEANVGLFAFESQLQQVLAAWRHLQGAGIKQALFTADHGFLLQDGTTQVKTFGKKTTPKPRYVLDPHERGEAGMVPVAMSKLGYDGMGGYLLLREDTAVYDTGVGRGSFVHGGNSPQERIIPVLTVTRKHAEAASHTRYAVEAERMEDAFGFHRLRLRVIVARDTQTGLGFAAARTIALDLHVPERSDIRATVKEISGPGSIKGGRVSAPVDGGWSEVFFALQGPRDERAAIEIHHSDNIETVAPCTLDALFTVAGLARTGDSAAPPTSSATAPLWADTIDDEGIRRVFVHLAQHGSIAEGELMTLLGNARAARRFAISHEAYLPRLPFGVRTESTPNGKLYVRDQEN